MPSPCNPPSPQGHPFSVHPEIPVPGSPPQSPFVMLPTTKASPISGAREPASEPWVWLFLLTGKASCVCPSNSCLHFKHYVPIWRPCVIRLLLPLPQFPRVMNQSVNPSRAQSPCASLSGCVTPRPEGSRKGVRGVRAASVSAALGSDPQIHMEVRASGEVRLECSAAGWYPEPQVQWRTSGGETFPSTSESRHPDEEGLFTVAASVIIRDASVKNISCHFQNLLLGQEKEVEISIPGR